MSGSDANARDAAGATVALPSIAEIEAGFEMLDGWEERFAYVIDLGRRLPAFPEAARVEANRVHGCQSTVFLTIDLVEASDGGEPRLRARAVSDASIVNGLIAIMLSLFDGRTAAEAQAIDANDVVTRLGLESHLSPTRRNGLHALIDRIDLLTRHAG